MQLVIRHSEGRTHIARLAAEQRAAQGPVAILAEGHLSVEQHLRHGGSVEEGAQRALEIYLTQGLDRLCQALSGEFALVIVDGQRLHLIADILDNVPLYWGDAPLPRGGALVSVGTRLSDVAEEMAAEAGKRCQPDRRFLTAFICNAVHLLQHAFRTPLEGVRRVPGGHLVTLDLETGSREARRYWAPGRIDPIPMDVPASIERLDETMQGAVQECFAHGSMAISLSGGLDSGSVAAYASRIAPEQTHCLTIGLQRWTTIPEEKFARQNAQAAGLALRVVHCDDVVPFRRFDPRTVYSHGLPVNILAEYHHRLAETAQGLGARVMVDGDGGDEFFGIGHAPAYLWELIRAGRVGTAALHLRGWCGKLGVSPLGILRDGLRRRTAPRPTLPPWLLLGQETAALFSDPIPPARASVADRMQAHQMRVNVTENWWNRNAVYASRNMRVLHPLRARDLAELTYALPQWILQNPADYKWLQRTLMRQKFPHIPFEPVNHDYSFLICHGLNLAKERLMSYFEDHCRLIAQGIATPLIRDFIRGYLRDPAGAEDWLDDGPEILAQNSLFAEMWLRGHEETWGK